MKHILLIASGLFLLHESPAQYVINQDFESHITGAVTVEGAGLENCAVFSQCNNGVCPDIPLMVSDKHARTGSKSLRFELDKNNWIMHHDGYCALRNEIRWNTDIILGEEAWIGFSVFPTLGEDGSVKYNSEGDSWICQIKNECGSGNRGGIQIRGDVFRISKDGMELGPVKYNEWNDIVLHYKYHETAGFINYYVNGVMFTRSYNTSPNSCKIDFKIGCYGWHPTGKTVLYFDEIKVLIGDGISYEDVVPGYDCLEQQAPLAPSNFTANATATKQVTLGWTDNSDNEKGFIIERKTQDGSFSEISKLKKDVTQYVDNQVVDGNTYFYKASSYNCFANSSFSEEVTVVLEKDHSQLLPIKSVSASNFLGSYGPANATDGKLNTYWLIDGEGEWLQLDFSETYTLERIYVSFIKGDEREYEFSVKASMNGTEWTDVGNFTSSGTTTLPEEFSLIELQSRYVRYITEKNSVDMRTWLAEIEFRGLALTSTDISKAKSDFTINQHPSDNLLQITIADKSFMDASLSVYNAVGQMVRKVKIHGTNHYLDTKLFATGLYIIQLENNGNMAVQKTWIQ